MKCSARRLITSSRIVKLIFIDPVLVVVTLQTVSVTGKSVAFKGRVLGAAQCGGNHVLVLSADGVLHLYDIYLNLVLQQRVGLPNEWASCSNMMVVANQSGTTVAFSQQDSTMKVYSLAENGFKYLGSVPVHTQTLHCVITNGLPGAPGLLLAFTSSFVKVVEISPMMPSVSTVRVSTEPILHVYPTGNDGDYLLLTSRCVRNFSIRDVLVGNFEFPIMKFPGPLVLASSTSLKGGRVLNMVVCGTKLFELVKSDGRMETEFLCKLPDFSNPHDMRHLFCISGAGLWLVRWFGRGTRGQFMINEDKAISELDPEYELDFDANDFLLDSTSNSLIGFGLQPNLDFVSDCIALTDLIEPLPTPMISGILFESDYKLLFAIFPTETVVFSLGIDLEGLNLKQIHRFDGKVLAVGSSKGVCTCIFETKRIYIAQYSHVVLADVPFDTIATAADISNGVAVISALNGVIYLLSLDSPDQLPTRLFAVEGTLKALRFSSQYEFFYSIGCEIFQYNITSMEQRSLKYSSYPVEEPIQDVICFEGGLYIAFRNGTIKVHQLPQLQEGNLQEMVPDGGEKYKLDEYPVDFIPGFKHLLIRGAGLWTLKGRGLIPIVCSENIKNESLSEFVIAGACELPFLDFSLLIAYNNQIRILSTEEMNSLMCKPQIYSIPLKNPVLSIKESKRFRIWVVSSESGLYFYDTKHRNRLKIDTDISSSENITAVEFWDIELDGNTYTHLVLGTKRPTTDGSVQYWLRTCSVKRDRNVIFVRKRLKMELGSHVKSLTSHRGELIVIRGNELKPVLLKKETGLALGDSGLTFEGIITDFSVVEDFGYISSTRGMFKVDLEQYLTINDKAHMVNRMRECLCHLVVALNEREFVLLGQKDCFLQVLELMNGVWRIVKRIDADDRILRMHRVESKVFSSREVIVVALTTNGSFVEIKLQLETQAGVETGPYLF